MTYLILAAGIQFVYSSMKYTQANHPSNIAWRLVSAFHGLLVWGTAVVVVGFIGMVLMESLSSELYKPIEPEQKPIDPVLLAERQRLYEEKLRLEEEERKHRKELIEQAEIQRRKLIEEERRTRSAEEAARSALDNF